MKLRGLRPPARGWIALLLPGLLGIPASPCPAQSPSAADTVALGWTISKPLVRAGERTVLRAVALRPAPGWRLVGPTPGVAGSIDILASDPGPAGGDSTAWVLELSVFELGEVDLSRIPFRMDSGSSSIPAAIRDLRVRVESTLPDSASLEDLRDIRGPVRVPLGWRWGRILAAGLLLAAGLAAVILWRRRVPRPVEAIQPFVPVRSPEDLALSALRDLEQEALPRRGMIKEHYFRLSGILRRYVEDRFRMPAVESTTWEIRGALSERAGREIRNPDALMRILEESDLVKFAKLDPGAEAAGRALGEARIWVESETPPPPGTGEETDAVR